ncbi:HYD1 [Apiospora arundinis]
MSASPPNPTSALVLPSGRTLGYALYGTTTSNSPETPTAFYHHGFPGSQGEAYAFDASARAAGVRLISVERPGMGASTFQPHRTLLDWPADLLALADHLAVRRFAVLGISGGGPYALACYHALPRDRCAGAALVCGLYPTSLGCGGMLMTTRVLLTLCPWVPSLCGWVLDSMLGGVARDLQHPEKLELMLVDDVLKKKPAHERAMLERDDVRAALVSGTRGSMVSGGAGAAWDGLVLGGEFGFKLEDVKIESGKVRMWHGAKDVNVPVHMAEKAAALMPGAELRVSPECAHIDLPYTKSDEIMQGVREMLMS